MSDNIFISKFSNLSKEDLEYKVLNPEEFEKEAVNAAKHILENYDFYGSGSKTNRNITEVKFVEKSYFKSRFVNRGIITLTLLISLISFGSSILLDDFIYAIWGTINLLMFVSVIVKHKMMLMQLKSLSVLALLCIVYIYTNSYIVNGNLQSLELDSGDLFYIFGYLFIILGGELLIEKRKVKSKLKRHSIL